MYMYLYMCVYRFARIHTHLPYMHIPYVVFLTRTVHTRKKQKKLLILFLFSHKYYIYNIYKKLCSNKQGICMMYRKYGLDEQT